MVAEEFGIDNGLLFHDAAVHVVALVDEETTSVNITILGAFAAVLPLLVAVGAIGLTSTGARVLAAELTCASSRVSDARMGEGAVDARQSIAVDTVIVAGLGERYVRLAAVVRKSVAVGPAGHAFEDTLTTGVKVSRVTIAVGVDGRSIDDVEARVQREVDAIEAWDVDSGTIVAKLIKSIKAERVAEIVQCPRAEIALSGTREQLARLADSAPSVNVLAAVTRIGVAILVIVETTERGMDASCLVAASTSSAGSRATFAEDLIEAIDIDVLCLRLGEVLRPRRAIEIADRGESPWGWVGLRDLATVLPIAVEVLAKSGVARDSARVVHASGL